MKISKKTLGMMLIIMPGVLLVTTLAAYAISSFVMMALMSSIDGLAIVRIIRIILSVMGIVSIGGVFIGIPLGIYFVTRKEPERDAQLRKLPRFSTLSDAEFKAVTSWSIFSFVNPLVWALGNKMWLWALGTFVPFWNIYVWLRLSIDGKALVWERSEWTVESFKKRQKIIGWVIVVLFFSPLIIKAVVSSLITPGNTNLAVDQNQDDGISEECLDFLDSDNDELIDVIELEVLGTNPLSADTDGDGYEDMDEILSGHNPNDGVMLVDTDGDGLADVWEEYILSSDPKNADSDGNGFSDLGDLKLGENPNGRGVVDVALIPYMAMVDSGKRRCGFSL
jgi:hypothetical protein